MDHPAKRGRGRSRFPAYGMATQSVAAGLGIIGSSFVREVLPFLRRSGARVALGMLELVVAFVLPAVAVT